MFPKFFPNFLKTFTNFIKFFLNFYHFIQEPEFKWTSKDKGFILSLFFYGYLFSPLGGLLSSKYGGTTIFGCGIGLTALLTILSPFLLRWNMYAYSVARVLEGLFEVRATVAEPANFGAKFTLRLCKMQKSEPHFFI